MTSPAFTSAAIRKHCPMTSTEARRIGSRTLAILVPRQGVWREKCPSKERRGSAVSRKWGPSSMISILSVMAASFSRASGSGRLCRQKVETPNIPEWSKFPVLKRVPSRMKNYGKRELLLQPHFHLRERDLDPFCCKPLGNPGIDGVPDLVGQVVLLRPDIEDEFQAGVAELRKECRGFRVVQQVIRCPGGGAGNLQQDLLHFRRVFAVRDRDRDRHLELLVGIGIVHDTVGCDLVVGNGDYLVVQGPEPGAPGPDREDIPVI